MTPLWADEVASGQVIWPLRFRFQVLRLLPRDQWATRSVSLQGIVTSYQQGFQAISESQLKAILARIHEVFGGDTIDDFITGPTIAPSVQAMSSKPPASPGIAFHRDLQAWVAEIGKLQAFYAQTEYPVPLTDGTMNIDDVWKREAGGVPTMRSKSSFQGSSNEQSFGSRRHTISGTPAPASWFPKARSPASRKLPPVTVSIFPRAWASCPRRKSSSS